MKIKSFFCAALTACLLLSGGRALAADLAKTTECGAALQQARQSYRNAAYKEASATLRREIERLGDKSCDQLWQAYRQAVLATAGDAYLESVPKDRYRVSPAVFGTDYKKEGIKKYFLLDVREPEEFVKGHIAGALNVPFRQVLRHLDWLPKPGRDKVLLIICRSQHRANHVLVVLRELGYTNAYTLQGGYHAYRRWLEHGGAAGSGTPPPMPAASEEDEEDFGC